MVTGGSAATGNLNISGGSISFNNRLALAVGTGSSAGGNVATVTMTGGTLTTDSAHNEDWHAGVNMASGYDTATGGAATFNLNGGTLSTLRVFSETGGTGVKGTSTFNFNGGTLQAQASRGNFMEGLTLANVRDGGAIVNTNGFDVTIAQALLHSDIGGDNAVDGGLTKNGAGVLTLSSVDNSFTGNIVVNAGTLRANGFRGGYFATGSLGANDGSRTITVNSGATLDFTNSNIFTGAGATATGLPQIVLEGGTMQSNNFNVLGDVTLNGGTLNQTSGGSGNHEGYEFLGSITVGGSAASAISSSNGKANHIAGGNNLLFTVADATSSSAADLIVSNPLRDGSGDYPGSGAITKAGAGTMTLAAAGGNTYSGGTVVSEGTLLANNSTGSATGSGAVTVQSGARLGGSGVVGLVAGTQNITVNNGGILSIGNTGDIVGEDLGLLTSGVGVITLNGTLEFDIYDNLGGTDNLSNPLDANDLLNLTSATSIVLSGTLKVTDLTGFSDTLWEVGDTWRLLDWSNVTAGPKFSGGFTTLDLPDLDAGLDWLASTDGSGFYIAVIVVPEPSRALLLLTGFMVLVLRRRPLVNG